MGFIDSLVSLITLAGGAYVVVYYVLPALQQMSYAPFYYMQAMGQQQQPQQQQMTDTPTTPLDDTPAITNDLADESSPLAEAFEDVLKSVGGGKTEDKETTRRKTSEETLKSSYREQEKKRAEYEKTLTPVTDPKAAGRAAAKALGFRTIVIPSTSRPYKYIYL